MSRYPFDERSFRTRQARGAAEILRRPLRKRYTILEYREPRARTEAPGPREGESMGLKWDAIDLDGGRLWIP
jgi:hypothetical protein